MTKAKSSKKGDHGLYKHLPRETNQCQPSSQWGDGERDERHVTHARPFVLGEVMKFEVLEVRKKANEIQDLLIRASGFFESKKLKCRREVSKALLNDRHKPGHIETVYSELLEVRKRGEVTHRAPVEPRETERFNLQVVQTNLESFDEREQTKLVRSFQRPWPAVPGTGPGVFTMVDCEGVVEMGNGRNVP